MAKLKIPYLILLTGVAAAFGVAVNWQSITAGIYSIPVAIGYGVVLGLVAIAAAALPAVLLGRAGKRLKLLNVFATLVLATMIVLILVGILID